jgi:hypothetical protein
MTPSSGFHLPAAFIALTLLFPSNSRIRFFLLWPIHRHPAHLFYLILESSLVAAFRPSVALTFGASPWWTDQQPAWGSNK